MPLSDLDILRTAQLLVQQHGEQALPKARAMVRKMRRRRDQHAADFWLRIIVAIGTLEEPPTEAKH